ncbi:cob(I)yrinic acid a,c-diamide adenosyltransferase [Candidatus Dojkabacteria bacterium]|nr:cob(I)yrinic acid a,c-diamide adenosyltransferase [Candidatus Dojkabacteria bacterium]
MKIYTKTGDKGETGVIGGRVSKTSVIIEALGNLDELNAILGVVVAASQNKTSKEVEYLIRLQNIVLNIGGLVAGGKIAFNFKSETLNLEKSIDLLNKDLSELTAFILPGGGLLSAQTHLARSISRRAERSFLKYIQAIDESKPEHMKIDKKTLAEALKFLNRMSDYLFTLARYFNKNEGIKDVKWNKLID